METEKKEDLSVALSSSLSPTVGEVASNLMEAGLDAALNEGVFKEIPIISTAIGVYKIGTAIKERSYLKKLAIFVKELNAGIPNEELRNVYKARIQENAKQRDREIEYIMMILDSYLQEDKANKLAKLYLEYLNGNVSWLEFTQYAEVINRFLPGDYEVLRMSSAYETKRDLETDAIQRLIALGLVIEDFRKATIQQEGGTLIVDPPKIHEERERKYSRTEFGNKLVRVLEGI